MRRSGVQRRVLRNWKERYFFSMDYSMEQEGNILHDSENNQLDGVHQSSETRYNVKMFKTIVKITELQSFKKRNK